jgi:hypothetical protein
MKNIQPILFKPRSLTLEVVCPVHATDISVLAGENKLNSDGKDDIGKVIIVTFFQHFNSF